MARLGGSRTPGSAPGCRAILHAGTQRRCALSEQPKPPRAHPFPDHDSIEFLIAHLRRLEETSAPPSAADYPPDWDGPYVKDGNATQALEDGAHLLGRMIRWAIRHKTGLAANGLLPGAPRYIGQFDPETTKFKLEQNLKQEHEASDDRHEVDGEAYEPGGDDPTVDRLVLVTLLRFYEPLFPPGLARYLAVALIALNGGQTLPLLQRKKRTKGKSFDLWWLRWRAVLHLEYLRGRGLSRDAAKDVLVKAYGGKPDAVDKWAGRVPTELLGLDDDIAATKADARRAGRAAKALLAKKDLSEDEREKLRSLEDEWGEPGAKLDGADYQNFLREASLLRKARRKRAPKSPT